MRAMRLVGSWGLALFLIFMFLQATIHPLPNPPEGSVKLFDPPGQNIVCEKAVHRRRAPDVLIEREDVALEHPRMMNQDGAPNTDRNKRLVDW